MDASAASHAFFSAGSADGVSSRGRLAVGSVEEALPKRSTALRRVRERKEQKMKWKEVKSVPVCRAVPHRVPWGGGSL